MQPATPKPSRRWLQFSLRGLLVVLTLVAIWLGVQTRRARDQERAVNAILSLEGRVFYDYEFDGQGQSINNPKPPGPAWLRRLIGEDYFRSVVRVSFGPRFGAPRSAHHKISDEDLQHLTGLRSLQWLDLGGQPIDGSGLRHVAAINSLEKIWLNWTNVNDDGIKYLRGLRNLRSLGLNKTRVTDAGLAHLRELQKLETLYLADCAISDRGLEHLRGLSKLENLDLSGTLVADAAAAAMADLPNLRSLNLDNTAVSDEGVKSLAGHAKLQEIRIVGSRVTARGYEHLRARLPDSVIDFGVVNSPGVTWDEPKWQSFLLPRLRGLASEGRLKYLNLSGGTLTDAMLLELKGLDGLQVIDLRGASVSEAAVRELQASLPECEIRY